MKGDKRQTRWCLAIHTHPNLGWNLPLASRNAQEESILPYLPRGALSVQLAPGVVRGRKVGGGTWG